MKRVFLMLHMLAQRRFAVAVLALLFIDALAFLVVVLTPGGRAGLRTAYVFAEVLPGVPSAPLAWSVGNYIEEQKTVSTSNGTLPVRIFRPADTERHPALILALGVTADYSDPILYKLSSSLASAGNVVLIPESSALAGGFLAIEEVENLVRAFEYLQSQPFVDSAAIGFSGFSVGASLSVLAAADARISDEVSVVNFFGGYVELSAYAAAILGRQFYDDGKLLEWDSKPVPGRVLRINMISRVQDPLERQSLAIALEDGSTLSGVSADTLAIYRYLSSQNYDDARLNEEALPSEHKQFFRELSITQALQTLDTKIFVLVDKRDSMVPYAESERAAQLANGRLAKFTQVSGFEHVRPKNFLSLARFPTDFLKLARHIHMVLDSL